MSRLIAVVVAAASAAAVLAVISTTGSAQTAGPQTIHLIATQKSQFFVDNKPRKRFGAGDVIGFTDTDKYDDGTTGIDGGTCTMTGPRRGLCHIDAKNAKGTLSFIGAFDPSGKTGTLAVAGGTGAYVGARGSLAFKDVTSKKTDVTVTLLG